VYGPQTLLGALVIGSPEGLRVAEKDII
jgi:hypothetical protein